MWKLKGAVVRTAAIKAGVTNGFDQKPARSRKDSFHCGADPAGPGGSSPARRMCVLLNSGDERVDD